MSLTGQHGSGIRKGGERMDGNYLSKAVHDEFARRMEDEHKRQNKRITDLEGKVEDISELTASVARLAQSVEQMAKSQEKHGKRLETLEQKPAKRWESIVEKAILVLVTAIITYALSKFGL